VNLGVCGGIIVRMVRALARRQYIDLNLAFMYYNELFLFVCFFGERSVPIDFNKLSSNTSVNYTKSADGSVKLHITTPRLTIRSVTSSDIGFYQDLWANSEIMDKFADGQPRHYSGSPDEKAEKEAAEKPYDYAEFRVGGWLNRLQTGDIWSGLTILDQNEEKIGHIIIGGGELAYFFMPSEWNKGYASEAAAVLTRIAVPTLITQYRVSAPAQIVATVREDHQASQAVLLNAGLSLGDELNIKVFNGQRFERYEAEVSTHCLVSEYENWKKSVAIVIPITNVLSTFFNQNRYLPAENTSDGFLNATSSLTL
jgi:RimJ/RimL family protein N-acetyltransferase